MRGHTVACILILTDAFVDRIVRGLRSGGRRRRRFGCFPSRLVLANSSVDALRCLLLRAELLLHLCERTERVRADETDGAGEPRLTLELFDRCGGARAEDAVDGADVVAERGEPLLQRTHVVATGTLTEHPLRRPGPGLSVLFDAFVYATCRPLEPRLRDRCGVLR